MPRQSNRSSSSVSAPRDHLRIEQARPVEQLHLPDAHDVVDCQQPGDVDARAGLLPGLAPGAFLGALAALQITRRHDPEPGARLDRPAAQQDAVLPAAHGADHHLGIEVVDLAAPRAHVALEGVAFGLAQLDRGAALAAKAHRRRPVSPS